MKTFRFAKVEYHTLERYYEALVSEEDVKIILSDLKVDDSRHAELIEALADTNNPRFPEVAELLFQSSTALSDWWKHDEDVYPTLENSTFDADIVLEEVIYDTDDEFYHGMSSGTLH
jgi:hypothetical protein